MMAARNHDRTREIINGFRLFDKTGSGPCTACCALYNCAAACLRCVRAFAANPCCPTRPYWCLLGPSTILGVLLCALRSNPMFIYSGVIYYLLLLLLLLLLKLGHVTVQDLQQLCKEVGEDISPKDLEMMIRVADANGACGRCIDRPVHPTCSCTL